MDTEQLIVPDFDTYPISHALVGAKAIVGGVEVCWDDGLECRLPDLWLQDGRFEPTWFDGEAVLAGQQSKHG